jgi:hypothetical protein
MASWQVSMRHRPARWDGFVDPERHRESRITRSRGAKLQAPTRSRTASRERRLASNGQLTISSDRRTSIVTEAAGLRRASPSWQIGEH